MRLHYAAVLIRRKKNNTGEARSNPLSFLLSLTVTFFPDKPKILKAQQKFILKLWGRHVITWILIPQRDMHGGNPAS